MMILKLLTRDLMKSLHKILLLAVMTVCFSCGKPQVPEQPEPPQEENPVEEPICIYLYDSKEYPVHSMVLAADDTQILVKISPFKEEDRQTTYAVIGIHASLEGQEIDVEKAWSNDDYYFIYESPTMYYSQFRRLQSGTIMIKRIGDGMVEVLADVVLPDEKVFLFEYSGVME